MFDTRTKSHGAFDGPRVIKDLNRLLEIARREHGPQARSTRYIEEALSQATRDSRASADDSPGGRWAAAARAS